MKDSIDTNWRPKNWLEIPFKLKKTGGLNAPGAYVQEVLEAINAGELPPNIEDIPEVVERVKAKHKLVELAEYQEPPMYHSDYRDPELYALICKVLKDAGFKKVKQ